MKNKSSNKEWCSELFYINPMQNKLGMKKLWGVSLEKSRPTTWP